MQFFSDNAAAVHSAVLDAITRANAADAAYDNDSLSQSLDGAFSTLFETDVRAFWITTGTAANSLALASLCPPYGSILCHKDSHIQNDECGAPEFFTHGAKLILIGGQGAKIAPDDLEAQLNSTPKGVHWAQPHALSITNATEYGQVYNPDDVKSLSSIAHNHGLGVHMDGARFANAVAYLGCSPAELTWKAGIDILSFGFIKNGGLSSEALIFFDPDKANGFAERRKRAGHLSSKGRFQAAQLLALLDEDRWLANARAANAHAMNIGKAAGARLLHPVQANEVFVRANAGEAAKLRDQGFGFYDWAKDEIRFVVSWDQSASDVDALIAALHAL